MGSSRNRHSTGRQAKSRLDHRSSERKKAFLAIRDELVAVRTRAAVVQQALTAEQGDPNAAALLLEGVCYPLREIVDRLEKLDVAVRS